MLTAVTYTSLTGSARRYAEALAEALALPLYEAASAPALPGQAIIHVGWVKSGKLQGLSEAMKKGVVRAAVLVGMSPVRRASRNIALENNPALRDAEIFCLQGAFHIKELPFLLRTKMMFSSYDLTRRIMAIEKRRPLTEAEQRFLAMAADGEGEPPDWDGIREVIDWARAWNAAEPLLPGT